MTLQRSKPIGLWTLVCLVIANMIGAGLYSSSCWSLASLGDAKLVLYVWIMGGVVAMCGAIAYGALAERLPFSGGEYLYLSRLVHPSVGLMAGWISLVAGFTSPIAAAAIIFGKYTSNDLQQSSHWPLTMALGVIVLAASVHILDFQWGAWLQNLVVAIKLLCLGMILIWAVVWGPINGWQSGIVSDYSPSSNGLEWMSAMLGSLVWISLSYTGFNAAIYLAGETSTGKQSITRPMWMATLIVTILYVALNAAFLYASEPDEIKNNEKFVSLAAKNLGGDLLDRIAHVAIMLSSATSVLGMMMIGPRVYARMADEGAMPRFFRAGTSNPRMAIGVQALLSSVVVLFIGLNQLISYMGLTLTACGALAIASLWRVKKIYPDSKSLVWYEQLAAVVFVFATILLLMAAFWVKPYEFWACVATFAIGGTAYALRSSQLEKQSA